MCVIAVVGTDAQRPTAEELARMARQNPHGMGVAWLQGKRAHWRKGLTYGAGTQRMLEALPQPFIVHFRIASAGGVDKHLTHPFPLRHAAEAALRGDAGRVLFHNGHWDSWQVMAEACAHLLRVRPPSGPLSDTRLVAALVARMGEAEGRQWLKRLATDTGQRFALLDAASKAATLYGQWTKQAAGWWASNTYWQAPTPTPTRPWRYTLPGRAVTADTVAEACALDGDGALPDAETDLLLSRLTDAQWEALQRDGGY